MATKAQDAVDTAFDLKQLRWDAPFRGLKVRMERVVTAQVPSAAGDGMYQYPLLTVTVLEKGTANAVEGDRYLMHCSGTVMISELKRVRPQVGDEFTVHYAGEKKTKSKRDVKVFEIDSDNTPDIDWDAPDF